MSDMAIAQTAGLMELQTSELEAVSGNLETGIGGALIGGGTWGIGTLGLVGGLAAAGLELTPIGWAADVVAGVALVGGGYLSGGGPF